MLTGENKSETARLLEMDRKTVTGWLDEALLERFRKEKK